MEDRVNGSIIPLERENDVFVVRADVASPQGMVAPTMHQPPASWVQVVESHPVPFDPDAEEE
eukprot:12386900-Alexandrium_andersonii.AAC.1